MDYYSDSEDGYGSGYGSGSGLDEGGYIPAEKMNKLKQDWAKHKKEHPKSKLTWPKFIHKMLGKPKSKPKSKPKGEIPEKLKAWHTFVKKYRERYGPAPLSEISEVYKKKKKGVSLAYRSKGHSERKALRRDLLHEMETMESRLHKLKTRKPKRD